MPHRSPIPHQLNAARGCVGKTEVQSLWRHRGATPQSFPEIPKDSAPVSQSRARRSRGVASARTPRISAIQAPENFEPESFEPESFEMESSDEHAPEIQDPNGHVPEMPPPGRPEPDEPGPDVPEPEVPEVPEPEPEHPTSTN